MFPEVVSPYSNVSDAAWAEAREAAMDRIYTREGVEREASPDEILNALDVLREQRAEEGPDWRDCA